MAIAKKGSRGIVVDGVALRWRVVPAIFGEGQVLISGDGHHAPTLRVYGSDFIRGRPNHELTPKQVAAIVRFAIAQGWRHDAGKPMRLVLNCSWDAPDLSEGGWFKEEVPTHEELARHGFRLVT